jgi:hypothetical protein
VELREKVATALRDESDRQLNATAHVPYPPSKVENYLDHADAILAIPEIAEALGRSYKGMAIVEDASLGPDEMKLVQPPNA